MMKLSIGLILIALSFCAHAEAKDDSQWTLFALTPRGWEKTEFFPTLKECKPGSPQKKVASLPTPFRIP